jgi:DNA (cytosine-5)-methyltransferase 1
MQVYYIEDIMSVLVVMIEGKCEVVANDLPNSNIIIVVKHVLYYEQLYNLDKPLQLTDLFLSLNQLPSNVNLVTLTRKVHASKKDKGKQICDGEKLV